MFPSIDFNILYNAAFVVLPTAYLTAFFAFRKYRSEKWWDRKFQCYFETIDALKDLIRVCDDLIRNGNEGPALSYAQIVKLKSSFVDIRCSLESTHNISELLLPEKASKALLKFNKQLFGILLDDNDEKMISTIYLHAQNCLSLFIFIARSDLKEKTIFGVL